MSEPENNDGLLGLLQEAVPVEMPSAQQDALEAQLWQHFSETFSPPVRFAVTAQPEQWRASVEALTLASAPRTARPERMRARIPERVQMIFTARGKLPSSRRTFGRSFFSKQETVSETLLIPWALYNGAVSAMQQTSGDTIDHVELLIAARAQLQGALRKGQLTQESHDQILASLADALGEGDPIEEVPQPRRAHLLARLIEATLPADRWSDVLGPAAPADPAALPAWLAQPDTPGGVLVQLEAYLPKWVARIFLLQVAFGQP